MKSAIHRDTWLEIDLTAISENVANIKKHYTKEKAIFAVVKADAYHHGAVAVALAV
ncbi:MAG: alanine racemase, partial [Culicoidibacterales bacterium]